MCARSVGFDDAPYAKVLSHLRILIQRETPHAASEPFTLEKNLPGYEGLSCKSNSPSVTRHPEVSLQRYREQTYIQSAELSHFAGGVSPSRAIGGLPLSTPKTTRRTLRLR